MEIDLTKAEVCDTIKSDVGQHFEPIRTGKNEEVIDLSPLQAPENLSQRSYNSICTPRTALSMNISDIDDSDIVEVQTPLSKNSFMASHFFSHLEHPQLESKQHSGNEMSGSKNITDYTGSRNPSLENVLNDWQETEEYNRNFDTQDNKQIAPNTEVSKSECKRNAQESIIYHKRYDNEDSSDAESDKENLIVLTKKSCSVNNTTFDHKNGTCNRIEKSVGK